LRNSNEKAIEYLQNPWKFGTKSKTILSLENNGEWVYKSRTTELRFPDF